MAEVDSSIAQNTYKPPSPLETLGQLYALKGQRQESQLRGIQVQQAGQSLKDDQSERAAFSQNTTVDPQTGQPVLNRQGALGQLYQTAPLRAVQRSQEFAVQDLARMKAGLENQKTQLANTGAQIGLAGQLAGSITDQTSYDKALQQGIQGGFIKPGQYPAVYDPQTVAGMKNDAMTAEQQLAAHQKELEQRETALRDHETMLHNQATEGNAQATLAQTTKRDANTAGYQRGELAVRGAQLGIDRGRLGVEQQNAGVNAQRLGLEFGMTTAGNSTLKGEDYINTLSPSMQPTVRAMVHGAIPLPTAASRGLAGIQRNAALQADPTLGTSRYETKNSYLTGDDSKTLQSLTTTLGHMEDIGKASDKLGTAPLLNTRFKSNADAGLGALAQGASGEIGKLITAGVVPEGEFNGLKTALTDPRAGNRSAAIQSFQKLIGDRVSGLEHKYEVGTGESFPAQQFYNKDTQRRVAALRPSVDSSPKVGSSGMVVNLRDAMALPQNKGKSEAEVKADVESHGHRVIQ